MTSSNAAPIAPIVFVTDLTYRNADPADLFDLGFLMRSERHDLQAVCLTDNDEDTDRLLNTLALVGRHPEPTLLTADGLTDFLESYPGVLNLVVTGGYATVWRLVENHRPLIREKAARIFLVGGHINDYAQGREGERLPIDPRLREHHPERFSSQGDPRVQNQEAFGKLLASGEGIIWLPRDICLWRYAAPQMLTDGGPLTEFLLRELVYSKWQSNPANVDRLDAAEEPVLLSSLPALLLATEPDPFAWMRLFRVIPARVEITGGGAVNSIDTHTKSPNLYAVIAIDGQALGKVMTKTLRIRPLTV